MVACSNMVGISMPFLNQVPTRSGTLSECPCGLIIRTQHPVQVIGVPLVSVDAHVTILNTAAEVTLRQEFINNSNTDISPVYFFPTEDKVAVHSFRAILHDQVVVGVVKDRGEATREFENAVNEEKTAFLVEQVRPDILELRVGCLKSGARCVVEISYVQELDIQESAPRFTLPTTIAPRYIPPDCPDDKMDQVNHQFTMLSDVPLTIRVNIAMRSPIGSITSPTHKIISEHSDERTDGGLYRGSVSLKDTVAVLDKDFVLLFESKDSTKEVIIVEKIQSDVEDTSDGEPNIDHCVMMSLVPKFLTENEMKCEFVFLVDFSGSMFHSVKRPAVEIAVEAVKIFLQSLPTDCYFNIVKFGSKYTSLSNKSLKYSEENLMKARKFISRVDSMGGTEILDPLKAIISQSNVKGYVRQVFVLTDGEVSNEDSILSYIRSNVREGRVFSLGVGNGASRSLVKGLARAGNGTALFCSAAEPMNDKVMELLTCACQQSIQITGLEFRDEEDNVITHDERYQNFPLSLYQNSKRTFYALLKGRPSTVRVKVAAQYDSSSDRKHTIFGSFKSKLGISANSDIVFGSDSIHFLESSSRVANEHFIHKLCARNAQQNDCTTTEDRQEIALRAGIVSENTSFVCVVEGSVDSTPISMSDFVDKDMKERLESFMSQDAILSACGFSSASPPARCAPRMGFGAGFNLMKRKKKRSMLRAQPQALSRTTNSLDSSENSMEEDMEESADDQQEHYDTRPGSLSVGAMPPPMAGKSPGVTSQEPNGQFGESDLVELLQLASIQGVFSDVKKVCSILKTDDQDFATLSKETNFSESVLLTMVVVVFLEQKYVHLKRTWVMVVKKSKDWLNRELVDGTAYSELEDKVISFISNVKL